MKILDRTFQTPEEDLSCDEALLDECEALDGGDILRFWSPANYFIVLGYSNAWKDEVQTADGAPVHRRCSGGGTVLQGPGCLNYSLILGIVPGGSLDGIRSTNEFVMQRHRQALEDLLGKDVCVQGHTDLTLGAMKFSGNSQRRKKKRLLFHGTFLLNFDLSRIERHLKVPAKQPVYRAGRAHTAFVTNLGVSEDRVKNALKKVWHAESEMDEAPRERMTKLAGRYARDEWRFKF